MSDTIVGGVREDPDGWRPVFQVHRPCVNDQHKGCTIITENVGPLCSSMQAAIDALMATRDTLNLDGWEGPAAKS